VIADPDRVDAIFIIATSEMHLVASRNDAQEGLWKRENMRIHIEDEAKRRNVREP
jgi:hypothetical protein